MQGCEGVVKGCEGLGFVVLAKVPDGVGAGGCGATPAPTRGALPQVCAGLLRLKLAAVVQGDAPTNHLLPPPTNSPFAPPLPLLPGVRRPAAPEAHHRARQRVRNSRPGGRRRRAHQGRRLHRRRRRRWVRIRAQVHCACCPSCHAERGGVVFSPLPLPLASCPCLTLAPSLLPACRRAARCAGAGAAARLRRGGQRRRGFGD